MHTNDRIFVLLHKWADDEYEDHVKTLGIFSKRENAINAIPDYAKLEGFSDHPDGFKINEYIVDKYVVDERGWTSGFITHRYRE
jgi:hypothetical protein